jgi:hypothetical protein
VCAQFVQYRFGKLFTRWRMYTQCLPTGVGKGGLKGGEKGLFR